MTTHAASQVLQILEHDAVFGLLPEAARRELAAAAKIEAVDRPVLLHPAGEPLAWLRLVLSGHLEIVARHAAGEEVAMADVGPGGWATWTGALQPEPVPFDYWSPAGARYLAVPCRGVRAACEQYPALYPPIVREMGQRIRHLMEWTGESVLLRPEQRMAKLIQLLARQHGLAEGGGSLPLTQARLARIARCSRQSANILLGALESRGLIAIEYGRCVVRDMAALQAFIAADPDDV